MVRSAGKTFILTVVLIKYYIWPGLRNDASCLHIRPVTNPPIFLRIFNIDRSFSDAGLSFGVRFQGHYRPVTAVAWLCCRVIFTQDQLSDSAMDAIGADEYVTVMCTSIRTVVFVGLLDSDRYKALSGIGSNPGRVQS